MTILVVSSWHERPDLLADQIESYNQAFGGDLIHCININGNFEERFSAEVRQHGIDFSRYGNVYFPRFNVKTAWAMIAQAYFNGVLDSMINGRQFEYVYFHTASDLMIKSGADRHVKQYDIGFGNAPGHQFTLNKIDGRISVNIEIDYQPFRSAMAQDHKLANFIRDMNANVINASRAEGCFFRRDLFFEITYPILRNYSIEDMENMPQAYPIEEYLLATCVENFLARSKARRTRHLVTTSENTHQLASVGDMLTVMKNPQLFGIKRFRAKMDDPDRAYARQLLQAPSTGPQ
jgi:hypothetical protein